MNFFALSLKHLWTMKQTILVEDVHGFPEHIACDSASKSEIVIPVHRNGQIIGVLDINSPTVGRFNSKDK